jgi:DNA-binding NarL/FixJ family response regulator
VARGLTNRQIAGNLDVAERTVDTHVEHILNKLGFGSRAQIAAWAVEQGLKAIEEPPSASPGVRSVQDRRPT